MVLLRRLAGKVVWPPLARQPEKKRRGKGEGASDGKAMGCVKDPDRQGGQGSLIEIMGCAALFVSCKRTNSSDFSGAIW